MTIRILLSIIIFIFSSSTFSANIRVLDFQRIIENNKYLQLLYDQINEDQKIHNDLFKNDELIMQKALERIEQLEIILEPKELEKEIEIYRKNLDNFNAKVEKFNLHYELQINNLKNRIVNIILEELKKYSDENKIDLVLDSTNYILSSNSINISKIIQDSVNSKQIEINFEKY